MNSSNVAKWPSGEWYLTPIPQKLKLGQGSSPGAHIAHGLWCRRAPLVQAELWVMLGQPVHGMGSRPGDRGWEELRGDGRRAQKKEHSLGLRRVES